MSQAPQNTHAQSGRTRDEAEGHDGMKVKLLAGTKRGQVGQVVILNWQAAQAEIAAGRAVTQE
jgi:hypothetical protein